MKIVIFYEKPGCTTNKKQKKLLKAAGCMVISRNLLDNGLSPSELKAFFGNAPVSEWFNPNAPKIKSGEVKPNEMTPATALSLLMVEPLLIRRPLMVINNRKISGFNQALIERLIDRPLKTKANEQCSANSIACTQ